MTRLQSMISQYENGAITLEELGNSLLSNHLAIIAHHAVKASAECEKLRRRQDRCLQNAIEHARNHGRFDHMEPAAVPHP